jgi:hypothetical protein
MAMTRKTGDEEVFASAQIFFLSDVEAILRIPKSQLKNMTNARSLLITPHRSAHGTGSRNVYDVTDLYKFAIASQLSTDGFAPLAIQPILDALGNEFTSSMFAIVASNQNGPMPWKKRSKPNVQVFSRDHYEQEGLRLIDGPVTNSLGCYVLNIGGIMATVDHFVEVFVRKNSAIYAPGKTPNAQRSSRLAKPTTEEPGILGSGHRKFRPEPE